MDQKKLLNILFNTAVIGAFEVVVLNGLLRPIICTLVHHYSMWYVLSELSSQGQPHMHIQKCANNLVHPKSSLLACRHLLTRLVQSNTM